MIPPDSRSGCSSIRPNQRAISRSTSHPARRSKVRPAGLEPGCWLSGLEIEREDRTCHEHPRNSRDFLKRCLTVRGRAGAGRSLWLTDWLTGDAATAASCRGSPHRAARRHQTMPAPPHHRRHPPRLQAKQNPNIDEPGMPCTNRVFRCRREVNCPPLAPSIVG